MRLRFRIKKIYGSDGRLIGERAMEVSDSNAPDVAALLEVDEANIIEKKRARDQPKVPTPTTKIEKREKLKRFGWNDDEIDELVAAGVISL